MCSQVNIGPEEKKHQTTLVVFGLINFIHLQANEDDRPYHRRPEAPAPGSQAVKMKISGGGHWSTPISDPMTPGLRP